MSVAPSVAASRFLGSHADMISANAGCISAPMISKALCIGMDECGVINGSPGFLSLRESDDGRPKTKQVEYLLLPEDYNESLDSPTTEGGETTEFGSSHDSADSCVDLGVDASVVNSARILSSSSEEDDDIFAQHLPDIVDLPDAETLDGPFASFSSGEVNSSNTTNTNIMGGFKEEEEVDGRALIEIGCSGHQAQVNTGANASIIVQQQQLPHASRQGSNTGIVKPQRGSPVKAPSRVLVSQPAPKQAAAKRNFGGKQPGGVSKTSTPRSRSKVQALPADISRSLALKAEAVKAATAAGVQCCRQCGTTNTPLWRGGPEGPKTLCNACGVRYMKTNKKPRERRV